MFNSSNYVLVVDDNSYDREIFGLSINVLGMHVRFASNGAEALAQVDEQRPSLILLDLHMPEMSGEEFLAYIRAHPDYNDIPVLVVTSLPTMLGQDKLAENTFVFEKTALTAKALQRTVTNILA